MGQQLGVGDNSFIVLSFSIGASHDVIHVAGISVTNIGLPILRAQIQSQKEDVVV